MAPNAPWLVIAMLLQGILALGLLWHLGRVRIPLVVDGKVKIRDIAVDRGGWPEAEHKVSNAFDNQFQLPVLFYVASLLALWLTPTLFELVLAYAFVLSRYVHAAIHITTNNVVRRFAAYTTGLVVLCVFWADLLVRTLLVAFGAS